MNVRQWLHKITAPPPVTPLPHVITVMELSTGHVPEWLGQRLDESREDDYPWLCDEWGIIVHPLTYGWLVQVPGDEPDAWVRFRECPGELLTVLRYAHAAGVHYILFDSDAYQSGNLPLWVW